MPALEEKRACRERLDSEYSHISDVLAQHRERMKRVEQDIARLREDDLRIGELSRPMGRLREIRERLDRQKAIESEYTRKKEELLRREERLRGIQQRALEIRKEIVSLQEKSKALEALEESIADYGALRAREELLSRAAINAEQLQRCLREIDAGTAEVQRTDAALGVMSEQIAGMEQLATAIPRAEALRDEAIAGLSAYGARREATLAEMERNRSGLSEILMAGPEGTCPTCHQGLGDHYEDLVRDLESTEAALRSSLDTLEIEQRIAEAERDRLTRMLEELCEKKTGYRRMAEEMARLQSRRENTADQVAQWLAQRQRQ